MRAIATLVFISTIAALVAGCVPKQDLSTAPTQPSEIVYTEDEAFSPISVTIPAGSIVRFDIVPAYNGSGHNVTFTTGTAGAPEDIPLTTTGKVDRTFLTKGVFHYNCTVHPGMSGQITVQ